MSTLSAYSSQIKNITNLAQQIKEAVNAKVIFDETHVGIKGSLKEYAPVFDGVLEIANRCTEGDLRRVAIDDLQRLQRYLEQISGLVNQARAYASGKGDQSDPRLRNNLTSTIETCRRELLSNSHTLFLMFMPSLDEYSSRAIQKEEEFNRLLDGFKQSIDEYKRQAETATKEKEALLDETLKKAREVSGRVAIADYSRFFDEEANKSRTVAFFWLGASLLSALALGWKLYSLAHAWSANPPNYSPIQAIQVGASKLALFTVALFAVTWMARAFKAQWHVFITNRHRANALSSIEAFANATKNEANREAIIVHACAAIFSQTNTGFIPDHNDAAPVPSVLEIIRNNSQ